MGVEAYGIKLTETTHSFVDVIGQLHSHPQIRMDTRERSNDDTHFLLFADGRHVVELRVTNPLRPVIYFRFALCNPPSIDTAIASLVLRICTLFQFTIIIMDEVSQGDTDTFFPPSYEFFSEVLRKSIASRRAEWKAAFGNVELGMTTSEALRRFVMIPS